MEVKIRQFTIRWLSVPWKVLGKFVKDCLHHFCLFTHVSVTKVESVYKKLISVPQVCMFQANEVQLT